MDGPFLRKKPHNICANIAILYFECLRGTTITPLKLYMTKSFFQEKKLVYEKDWSERYLYDGFENLALFLGP